MVTSVKETDIVQPAPLVAYRLIGDQVAIVHPGENRLLTLNDLGSRVWMLLDGRSLGRVVDDLLEEYDVDRPTLSNDVGVFVEELLETRLLVRGPVDEVET